MGNPPSGWRISTRLRPLGLAWVTLNLMKTLIYDEHFILRNEFNAPLQVLDGRGTRVAQNKNNRHWRAVRPE